MTQQPDASHEDLRKWPVLEPVLGSLMIQPLQREHHEQASLHSSSLKSHGFWANRMSAPIP